MNNLIPKIKLFIDEAKNTLRFLPSELKKTIKEGTWIPLSQKNEPLNIEAGQGLTPSYKTKAEAKLKSMVEMGKAPVEAFGILPLIGALQKKEEGYDENKGNTIPFINKLNKPLFINK